MSIKALPEDLWHQEKIMSTRDLMSPDPVEKMINIYDNHEPHLAKQLR